MMVIHPKEGTQFERNIDGKELDEKGILKAAAFEWGAGEDRYGGGVGASI